MLTGYVEQVVVLNFDPWFCQESLLCLNVHNKGKIIVPQSQREPRSICNMLSKHGLQLGAALSQQKAGQHIINYLNGMRKEYNLSYFSG